MITIEHSTSKIGKGFFIKGKLMLAILSPDADKTPILISTEAKVFNGDLIWNPTANEIEVAWEHDSGLLEGKLDAMLDQEDGIRKCTLDAARVYKHPKILAMPDDFTDKHLELISSSDMKEDEEVFIECEEKWVGECTCNSSLESKSCDDPSCEHKTIIIKEPLNFHRLWQS